LKYGFFAGKPNLSDDTNRHEGKIGDEKERSEALFTKKDQSLEAKQITDFLRRAEA
jgi:hypothetical protein